MKKNWLRILSALTCACLLLSSIPSFSEEASAPIIETFELPQEESFPVAAAENVADEPAAAPASEAAEESTSDPASEASVEIVTETADPMEITDTVKEAEIPAETERTEAPDATEEPEGTAAPVLPSETPAPEASAAPVPEATEQPLPSPAPADEGGAQPEASPSPEETVPAITDALFLTVDELTSAVDKYISALEEQNYTDDYDKAFWLYRQLIQRVKTSSSAGNSAEAALMDGKASSRGFALAYETLLDHANIASSTLSDKTNSTAWNVVRIDGEWMHVDVYTDARSGKTGASFGLTDGAMARFHSWGSSSNKCDAAELNYYVREKDYLACANTDDLYYILSDAAAGRISPLKIYWSGNASAVDSELAEDLLLLIAPDAEFSIKDDGCYCEITIDYGAAPTVTSTATVKPSATAAPTATLTPTTSPTPAATKAVLPEEIIPVEELITLGLGEKRSIASFRFDPAGADADVRYRSANPKYASVNDEGVVTAKKEGKAIVVIETENGLSCKIRVAIKAAPTKISFTAERTELGVGESISTSYKFNSGAAGSVRYISSDESIATVDENGLITAHAPGEVKISVKSYNGLSRSGKITVLPAPEELVFEKNEITIAENDSYALPWHMSSGSGGTIVFSSSDEETVAVNQEGKIKALKQGFAVITAESYNDLSAQCAVTVSTPPESVVLCAERTTLGVGEKLQLNAEFTPEGVVGSLKYSSNNAKYVSVNSEGVVNAKGAGSATITAKTAGGKKDSIKITVKKAPIAVKLRAEKDSIAVGENIQLNVSLPSGCAGSYRLFSSDENKLVIGADGLATALSGGEVKVGVETYNGKKASLTLNIIAEPESIELNRDEVSIGAQDSWHLEYKLNEGAGGTVRFTSTDETIASVDASGRISAHGQGFAIITAETYNGLKAQCFVRVVAAPEKIRLLAERDTLGVGESMQLTAETLPDGALGTLKYVSGNEKILSVDENGVVTGRKAGSATIHIKTYNGKTASLELHVKAAPKAISLAAARNELGVGESVLLLVSLPENTAGSYSLTSGDPSVLEISEHGIATAVSEGEVTVSVTAYNGVKKSLDFTVKSAPTFLTASPAKLVLGEGEEDAITVEMDPGSAGALTFRSSNHRIVQVDENTGAVTAVSQGSAKITAESYNGVSASVEVRVLPLPSFLKLAEERLAIGLDDSIQLIAKMDEGSSAKISYASKNSKIASVDASGVLTGKRTGETKISLRSSNGLEFILDVEVKAAPKSISFPYKELTLGVGESMQLEAVLSKNSAGSVFFESEDPLIASVNEEGLLTAHSQGEVELRAVTYNGKSASISLTVVPAPESIEVDCPSRLGVGQQHQLSAAILPEGSHTSVRYEVVEGSAVMLDEEGVLTAVSEGRALLRAFTHAEGVYQDIKITVKPAPKSVSFQKDSYELLITDTLQLQPVLTPSDCVTSLLYEIERAGFFTIDENGLVTPIMRGESAVRVTTHNGLSAETSISVIDPYFPEELRFLEDPPSYLEVGDGYTPQIGVFPETAIADLVWKSSDPDIATVNEETGLVVAESHGSTTIEATSRRNPALTIRYKLVVLNPERCLVMPNRRTDTSKISTTLSQIKKVRSSAYRELEALYTRGEISKSEYSKRQSVVSRAFDMYLFPWMTETKEPYWKAANSENGAKDFKPGTVYYGMAYTQTNRRHTVSSMLSAGLYKDSGKGYYLLQGDKFPDRAYPGNDCSAFAAKAVWGASSSYSNHTTRDISTSGAYNTVKDWTALRPGDLLNKHNHHVVIFLYYTNVAKTQMVVIEQGGGEDGINTVSSSIRSIAYYRDSGYVIRRPSSLS